MKKIVLFISIIMLTLGLNAQSGLKTMGAKTAKTSGTYVWAQEIFNSGDLSYVSLGMVITTVNTSNFQGNVYLDASFDKENWEPQVSLTSYTFTQSSGVNSTVEILNKDDWNFPYARVRAVLTSDAQTVTLTPYIQRAKKE